MLRNVVHVLLCITFRLVELEPFKMVILAQHNHTLYSQNMNIV